MSAQDFHTDRVKRAHPRHALDLTNQMTHPIFHLARGLIGKSDRENFIRTRRARIEQMRDAGGERFGFTGPCPRQHQNRSAQLLHRRALRRVQPVHIGRRAGSHGHLTQAGGCGGLKGL